MSRASSSGFRTARGQAAFFTAYDQAMKLWPVPYEEIDVPTRFGTTHVAITGPKDGPPLVLLHGYAATLAMWALNVRDFSRHYRVYALDVMGQPGKSVPDEPVTSAADYVEWLTATLNALHLDRISLIGMSFGGYLALNYAIAAPERVQKLVLLSAGGLLPMVRQFVFRGMLMSMIPTHLTVNTFMHWLGFPDDLLNMMYLGLRHFRIPTETLRVLPVPFTDEALRGMRVPTLLLYGEHEVICDPVAALARAQRLIPDFRGELIPASSHDMVISQYQMVNTRVLDFLKETRGATAERSVA